MRQDDIYAQFKQAFRPDNQFVIAEGSCGIDSGDNDEVFIFLSRASSTAPILP